MNDKLWKTLVLYFLTLKKDFLRLIMSLSLVSYVYGEGEIQQTSVAIFHQENAENTATLNIHFI